LDRIGRSIDALPPAVAGTTTGTAAPAPSASGRPGDTAETALLREALEAERTANAQLTERVRAIKERQENMVGQLERKVARLTQQLDAQGLEVARQKRANAGLTESLRALREANGSVDARLVNKSILAELEALRAARASEIAEMDEILHELKPFIGEAAHA